MFSTDHGRNGIMFIERGLAYPKTEETDFCWTSYGQNGVLLTGRGVAYRKTDETDLCSSAMVETGGGVWRTAKRDSTGYCSSPPSTSSSLHGLPSASTACYSTGYYSTTPARAPLHRLLFIWPSTPWGLVQPPLHGHPSTVYCSSSPPHHGVLFIQRQRHRSLFIQPPLPATLTVHPIDRLQ